MSTILVIYSPGTPEPYHDKLENQIMGNISEKTFTTVNSVKQGMFIKSKSDTNPVLLFLHGPVKRIFRPVAEGKLPTGQSLKAVPVCVPPPIHLAITYSPSASKG